MTPQLSVSITIKWIMEGYLSSAGMVLLYLQDAGIIDSNLYAFFHRTLVGGVDAHDNGLVTPEEGHLSFSHIISTFNPIIQAKATNEQYDEAFFKAFHFTFDLLKRFQLRYEYEMKCSEIVAEKMEEAGQVPIFEESIPWIDSFFKLGGENHPAKFVVMPAGKHWKLRGIPPSLEERMATRYPHPKNWAGLMKEELQKITGISGAIFCHKGGFISVWETKEDALKALDQVVMMEVEYDNHL